MEPQLQTNVLTNFRRGRGRKCGHRRVAQTVDDWLQTQVVGTKVMSPFRNAVGFVDGEQRDPAAAKSIHEMTVAKSFRCDIQELEFALPDLPEPLLLFSQRQRTVDERGGYLIAP